MEADRAGWRSDITGPDQFKTLCVKALQRLQRMPHLDLWGKLANAGKNGGHLVTQSQAEKLTRTD